MAGRVFVHNGAQREIGRIYAHAGGSQRTIKVGYAQDSGGQYEVFRHLVVKGTMTQGSISQGTSSVTTRRGFVNGFCGSKVDAFGENYDVLSTYQRTGAVTIAIRTRFVTIGPQYQGFAKVRVSLDGGANFETLEYSSDSELGESSFWVLGNVFNLTSGTNGTTYDVRVEWVE